MNRIILSIFATIFILMVALGAFAFVTLEHATATENTPSPLPTITITPTKETAVNPTKTPQPTANPDAIKKLKSDTSIKEVPFIPASTGWHLESEQFSGEPIQINYRQNLSPDGKRIVYRIPSGRMFDRIDSSNDVDDWLEMGSIDDIWTAELNEDNILQSPTFIGQVEHPGIGCGGAGDSWADRLYNIQSHSFESSNMYWTADDILIYPLECGLYSGYGRFDMNTGEMLPRIPGKIYNLTVSNEKDRWFAITAPDYNAAGRPILSTRHLVTGVPSTTKYQEISTTTAVDILYVGPQDGRLYYTSRESIQTEDLSDKVGYPLGSQFHFFHTQLYSIAPDGTDETLHWEGDDHSYSRITQDSNGDLLFYLIENDTALLEAVQNDVPETEWPNYAPKVYLMRQTEPLAEPTVEREDFEASTILESFLP